MDKKVLRFYFIRHGKTEWNISRQMQGWGDSPLVEEGINGAKAVGDILRDVPFEAVYTSTSKRTQDTANLITNEKYSLHPLEELREMHFGTWEGVSILDLDRDFPEEREIFMTDAAAYTAEVNGGETFYELADRVRDGLEKIVANHEEGNILVVSHGMTLSLLLHLLAGGGIEDYRTKAARILNTSVSVVCYEDGKYEIEALNQVEHLV